MRIDRLGTIVIAVVALGISGLSAISVNAQSATQAAKQAPKQTPLGSSNGWKSKIDGTTGSVSGKTFDPEQIKQIELINSYFNDMEHLQGVFLQSTSDNKQSRGRFFVHRPGRFRFNYASPSKLVILSDGRYLSIEDHDLQTVDRYPLESTPFRILLAKKVDILRDAQVMDMFNGAELLAVTLRDKSGDAPGTMKLFFQRDIEKEQKITLKEWVITDAQGVDTRIKIERLVSGQKVDAAMFTASKMQFQTGGNN